MSVEENLRLSKESAKAFNGRDWDRYYELRAESIVLHDPAAFPEDLRGRAAHRGYLEATLEAFPDSHMEVERAFGQGDWIALEYVMTGTHTGPLALPGGQPIPPTNNPFRLEVVELWRWEGGQIVEERPYYDSRGFLAQIGLASKG